RTIDYEPGNSIIPPPYQTEPLEVKHNNPVPAIIGVIAMLIGIGLAVFWSLSNPSTDEAPIAMEAGSIGMVQGPVSSIRVTEDTPLRAGQRLHVLWDNNWYMGTAMHVDPTNGEVIIRYDGWGEQYDELVPRNRLRLVK
ncbi:MAG: hypothetical protein JXX14_17715, partial [Deltaproteobacteria bacterium]|nr:hypothetical protein [Deltaproteobacteria bacterium]